MSDEHPVFYYLIQSRKRVYADHAVQVRVAAPVLAVPPVLLKVFLFQVDFSSYHYRVAIGYPTNALRRLSFHNIHRNASSVPGVFLYDITFVVACRMSITDSRSPNTQGESEMWYPTIQAMIGKLYVLSHFYNMYVAPRVASVHIMFTTLFPVSQQFSSAICWRERATIDGIRIYAHGACAAWTEYLSNQRPRRAPIGILYR